MYWDSSWSSKSHENYIQGEMGTLIFTVKTMYSAEGGGLWYITVYISSRLDYREIEMRGSHYMVKTGAH